MNEPYEGKATTTAKFSEPGEYVLQVTANDYSGDGGGGFQCCWTNSLVKVDSRRSALHYRLLQPHENTKHGKKYHDTTDHRLRYSPKRLSAASCRAPCGSTAGMASAADGPRDSPSRFTGRGLTSF